MCGEGTTPVILTWNEESNIGRCIESLSNFPRIVVLDSGSMDATEQIARSFANVAWFTRPFDNHTNQWNHGIGLVNTPWVLSLDADYVITEAGLNEIQQLNPAGPISAFYAPFRYKVFNKILKGSLYPPRAVLFRKDRARYVPDGHTQKLEIDGETATLINFIIHDDRKSLSRWIDSQKKYASLEADKLSATNPDDLGPIDRMRLKSWIAPILTFLYCLFRKGLIFQGTAGWYYTFQRTLAEVLLSLNLLDRKLRK